MRDNCIWVGCAILLFCCFGLKAQIHWANTKDGYKANGQVTIKDLSGNTVNVTNSRASLGVSSSVAPMVLVTANASSTSSIGVVFDDYSSLVEDGSGGYKYQDKATTLAAGYDINPVANVLFVSERLAGHWWIPVQFTTGLDCYNGVGGPYQLNLLTNTKYSCGGTSQNYNPSLGNSRDLSGIVASYNWTNATYDYGTYTERQNTFYPNFQTPAYKVLDAKGDEIYSESIHCGGWTKINAAGTSGIYMAYDHLDCVITMTNPVETYYGKACLAEFSTGSYSTSCNHPSYGTQLSPTWDDTGVKLKHDLKYGSTKKHNLFYTNHGSRIVASDNSYSTVMPAELEDAIASKGLAVSSFGGGTHTFTSGNGVYSFNDDDGSSKLVGSIPSNKKIIGNIAK